MNNEVSIGLAIALLCLWLTVIVALVWEVDKKK